MIQELKTRFNGVIKIGDHLVVLYDKESDITETIVSYISSSINNNQKCIYIIGDTNTELIIDSLKKMNMYSSFIESNQLVFLDKKDAYSKSGSFNPEKMKNLLITLSKEAQEEGYLGLAISGEISWVLEYDKGFDLINEYEWKINSEVFGSYPVTALCRYNMDKFTDEMIINVIQLHPFLIIDNKVYENPFYIPAIAYETNDMPKYQVKTWLENIVKYSNTKSEFNARIKEKEDILSELSVTNEKLDQMNKKNLHNLELLGNIFENSIINAPVPIMVHADDGTVLNISDSASELTLYSKDDIKTIYDWTEKAYGKKQDEVIDFIESLYSSPESRHEGEFEVTTKDGRKLIWDFNSGVIGKLPDGRAVAMSVGRDVTELTKKRKNLIESFDRLDRSQKISNVGSWELDLNSNIMWGSQEAFNIYELSRSNEYIDVDLIKKMVSEEDNKMLEKALADLVQNGNPYDVFFTLNVGNRKKHINSRASISTNPLGKPIKVLGVIKDITKIKQKEDELMYISYHDSLTSLYNRRYYKENLIKLDIPENYPITIVLSDINGLKLVNDAFGHIAGDELLISAAKIISNSCGERDLIARIGGDEFVIVMPNTNGIEAERIITKINNESKKITIESIELSISFGFATKNNIEMDIQETYRSAEDSMYRVKLLEIPSMRSSAIETILNTLYEKDENSEVHSRAVSAISERLAVAYGMNRQEVNEVKTAGILHDIGKIIIPISIITKKGKLTKEEYSLIKGHPEIGFRILNSTHDMRNISNLVLYHHERWDGLGYPRGIKGQDIPLQSRMISIADAFDAMTSERTYREILTKEEALKEIMNNAGTQFDPDLVEVFNLNFDEIIIDIKE